MKRHILLAGIVWAFGVGSFVIGPVFSSIDGLDNQTDREEISLKVTKATEA